MTRNHTAFLRPVALTVLLATATLFGSCCGERPVAARRFQILQLNDVYRIEGLADGKQGGLARVRTLRERLEANPERGPVLVLHAGDILYPSVMSKMIGPESMIDILNRLDGKASAKDPLLVATFGNHEFDMGDDASLREAIELSGFDWVSSNVYLRGSDGYFSPPHQQFDNVHRVVVREVGGVRVGILGLTVAETPQNYVLYDAAKLSPQDPPCSRAVRAAIAELREQGAEFIIALTHQEMPDDVALAERFQGIDLVIGGHEHFALEKQVGDTWVTKGDADAVTVRVLEVDMRQPPPARVYQREQNLSGIPKDSAVEERVQHWVDELEKEGKKRDPMWDQSWVQVAQALDGTEQVIRGQESRLGNWLADVMREKTGADVALVPGGSIRLNDVIERQLEGRHLAGIFYFDSDVVTTCMSREALCKTLRNGVSRVSDGAGRFLHVSGLRFAYDPRDARVAEGDCKDAYLSVAPQAQADTGATTTATAEEGAAPGLDCEANLKVATLEYTYVKGAQEGFVHFDPESRADHGSFRAMTEAWLGARRGQVLDVPLENRIQVIEPADATHPFRIELPPGSGTIPATDPPAPSPPGTSPGGGAVDTR